MLFSVRHIDIHSERRTIFYMMGRNTGIMDIGFNILCNLCIKPVKPALVHV